MGERKMTLGTVDKRRNSVLMKRLERRNKQQDQLSSPEPGPNSSTPTADSQSDHESEYKPSPEKNSESRSQIIVLNKEVIEETMRTTIGMDISAHKMTAAITKLVTAAGGNPDKLPLSYASAFRMKNNIITKDSDNLKLLIHNEIKHGNLKVQLHFDGKIIQVS